MKVGIHKHNFLQPCMAGEFSPITRDIVCIKKETFVKLIYSIKTNLIANFFSKYLVKFLRNSIKYLVQMRSFESSFGCTFGYTKGCTFDSYDYSKRILS